MLIQCMASLQANFLFGNGNWKGHDCVSGKKVKVRHKRLERGMKRLHVSMIEEF